MAHELSNSFHVDSGVFNLGGYMKTVVIDGVEYEEKYKKDWRDGTLTIVYGLIPKPKRTLVEIAAEAMTLTEQSYRSTWPAHCAALDAIEERLKALEEK